MKKQILFLIVFVWGVISFISSPLRAEGSDTCFVILRIDDKENPFEVRTSGGATGVIEKDASGDAVLYTWCPYLKVINRSGAEARDKKTHKLRLINFQVDQATPYDYKREGKNKWVFSAVKVRNMTNFIYFRVDETTLTSIKFQLDGDSKKQSTLKIHCADDNAPEYVWVALGKQNTSTNAAAAPAANQVNNSISQSQTAANQETQNEELAVVSDTVAQVFVYGLVFLVVATLLAFLIIRVNWKKLAVKVMKSLPSKKEQKPTVTYPSTNPSTPTRPVTNSSYKKDDDMDNEEEENTSVSFSDRLSNFVEKVGSLFDGLKRRDHKDDEDDEDYNAEDRAGGYNLLREQEEIFMRPKNKVDAKTPVATPANKAEEPNQQPLVVHYPNNNHNVNLDLLEEDEDLNTLPEQKTEVAQPKQPVKPFTPRPVTPVQPVNNVQKNDEDSKYAPKANTERKYESHNAPSPLNPPTFAVATPNDGSERVVEKIVEKVVEKRVEVPVEKIVEVPVDRIVEKRVEVPVDRVVEKLVERRIEVPKEVHIEKIVERRVEVPVEVKVEVPVEKVIERIVNLDPNPELERQIEALRDLLREKQDELQQKQQLIIESAKAGATAVAEAQRAAGQQLQKTISELKEKAATEIAALRQEAEEVRMKAEADVSAARIAADTAINLAKKETESLRVTSSANLQAAQTKAEEDLRMTEEQLAIARRETATVRKQATADIAAIREKSEKDIATLTQKAADESTALRQKSTADLLAAKKKYETELNTLRKKFESDFMALNKEKEEAVAAAESKLREAVAEAENKSREAVAAAEKKATDAILKAEKKAKADTLTAEENMKKVRAEAEQLKTDMEKQFSRRTAETTAAAERKSTEEIAKANQRIVEIQTEAEQRIAEARADAEKKIAEADVQAERKASVKVTEAEKKASEAYAAADRRADQRITEMQQKAAEEIAKIRQEAAQMVDDNERRASNQADQVQLEADRAVQEANEKASKRIAEVESEAQAQVEAANKTVAKAKEELSQMTNRAQRPLLMQREGLTALFNMMKEHVELIQQGVESYNVENNFHNLARTITEKFLAFYSWYTRNIDKADKKEIPDAETFYTKMQDKLKRELDNQYSWIVQLMRLSAYSSVAPVLLEEVKRSGIPADSLRILTAQTYAMVGRYGITLSTPSLFVDEFEDDKFISVNAPLIMTFYPAGYKGHATLSRGIIYDLLRIGYSVDGEVMKKPEVCVTGE